MKMLDWQTKSGMPTSVLGLIPQFIFADDPRPAAEQFNERYAHGGGWSSFGKGEWGMDDDGSYALKYPGDPRMYWIARAQLRDETILFYPHAWVAIVQADGAFEVSRMD